MRLKKAVLTLVFHLKHPAVQHFGLANQIGCASFPEKQGYHWLMSSFTQTNFQLQ